MTGSTISTILIGWLALFSQPAVAQGETARDLVILRGRDDPFAKGIRQKLDPASRGGSGWREAWRQSHDMGLSVEPLLIDMWRQESYVRRKLLLLAAAAVAAGGASDRFQMERIGPRADTRERVLTLMILAMGPERPGPGKALSDLMARGGLDVVEKVAACLALRRYRAALDPPERWYVDGDPGLAAAVRYARGRSDDPGIEKWLEGADPNRQLVERGFLLGILDGPRSRLDRDLVRRILQRPDAGQRLLRNAAAICLSRGGDVQALIDQLLPPEPPDPALCPVLAADPGFRAELARRGFLKPPPDRLAPGLRGRAALAFALETDGPRLLETAAGWRRDPVAGKALCLGLAWRFYRRPGAANPEWLAHLPPQPEAEWARLSCLAAGADPAALRPAPARAAVGFDDEPLDRAYRLALRGQLPPAAAAAAIESALWRSGAHLGQSEFEAESELCLDLLLAGSAYAADVLRRERLPYLAGGSHYEDDPFFSVCYECFDFLRTQHLEVPEQYRLR